MDENPYRAEGGENLPQWSWAAILFCGIGGTWVLVKAIGLVFLPGPINYPWWVKPAVITFLTICSLTSVVLAVANGWIRIRSRTRRP